MKTLPPLQRPCGALYTTAECRELFEVVTLYEGPSCGSDGTTKDLLQEHTYIAHEIEQQLLEIVHKNPSLQVPDAGTENGDLRVNENKNIHVLTRAVVHGNPKVPTNPGERSAVLLVRHLTRSTAERSPGLVGTLEYRVATCTSILTTGRFSA